MNNNKNSRSKSVLFALVVLLFVYILVVATVPSRKLSELKHEVYSDSLFHAANKAILKNQKLFELAKIRSRKEAEMVLAQKDTFGIVVDLNDSIVWLMLKGVRVHGTKFQHFEQDRFFQAMSPLVYVHLFSKPLRTQHEFATIVKEPIVTMKAPKDTIEAINNAYMPDTLIQQPAYFRLDLEKGFRLIMVQKQFSTPDEKKVERQFMRDLKYREMADNAKSFIPWKKASYTPTLVLYLNANEIRSIYRAVPENVQVIFSY